VSSIDDDDLLHHQSVRTWLESVQIGSLRPEADRKRRLELMRQYVDHVGVDPGTIIARSRADAKDKNQFLKQLVAWATTLPGSEKTRHDAENAIRGFFMRNGFRVVAKPYRDVYQRPGSTPS
jgi:hypothetical protein